MKNRPVLPAAYLGRLAAYNLATENPTKVAELNAKLDAFLKDTDALMPIPNQKAAKNFDTW